MDPFITKMIFLAGLIVTNLVIRPRYIREHGRRKIHASVRTQQEKALLGLVSLGYCLLPLVYMFTPVLRFADHAIPAGVSMAGVVLLTMGNWLFWRSHVDLGSNWSPRLDMREDHKLITHGIYQRIRHPMYAALWLIVISQAMLLQNAVAGFAGPLAFGLLYVLRVSHEEKMMLDAFGPEYATYMQRTGRIFPKLK